MTSGSRIIPIDAFIQPYAWGSATQLAEFLEVPPTGSPMAEAWFGVHPAGPSSVADDPERRTLADVLRSNGQELSFLLKVLSIAAPLSLQLHPTTDQARAGFADENRRGVELHDPLRVFRDENHKPELICALTELDALCGFRARGETIDLLETIGGELAGTVARQLRAGDELRDLVRRLLLPVQSVTDRQRFDSFVAGAVAAGEREPDPERRRGLRWIGTLGANYRYDGGVVVASLLNCVRLQPGEALFLDAGNMHAYLHGLGVEIMANSDNVVRGGLTTKHIAIDVLTELVDVSPSRIPLVTAKHTLLPGGATVETWPVPVRDFSLARVTVGPETPGELTLGRFPAILLCSEGSISISTDSGVISIEKGRSVYVAPSQDLSFAGRGEFFVASSTDR